MRWNIVGRNRIQHRPDSAGPVRCPRCERAFSAVVLSRDAAGITRPIRVCRTGTFWQAHASSCGVARSNGPNGRRPTWAADFDHRPRFNRQNPFGGGEMIRVLLVDDHEFFRMSVASILGEAEGIIVVGECADGAEVLDKADATLPDVVLMDVTMPIVQGPDATQVLLASHPGVRVLMLSATLDARAVAESAQAGAAGFLFKDGDAAALIGAIRNVAAGGTAWPEDHPSEPRA